MSKLSEADDFKQNTSIFQHEIEQHDILKKIDSHSHNYEALFDHRTNAFTLDSAYIQIGGLGRLQIIASILLAVIRNYGIA